MKRFLLLALSLSLVFTACTPAPVSSREKATPNSSLVPTLSSAQTDLPLTSTLTPTSALPALQGTPYPLPVEAISPENAARVTALARWGNGTINFIALSPDGQTLAAATAIGVVLYAADTLELRDTLLTDLGVEALAFSPDGLTLAAGSAKNLLLCSLAGGKLRIDLSQEQADTITSLAYSPNGKWLAVGTENGTLVYDTLSGQFRARLNDPEDFYFRSKGVAFSPDGRLLATAQFRNSVGSGPIMLWDAATFQLQDRFEEGAGVLVPGALTFLPDGQTLAFPSSWYYAWLWNTATGTTLQPEAEDRGTNYRVLAVSPDGNTLAAGSYYGILNLWDTATGGNRRSLQTEGPPLVGLIFSPDGKSLFAASTDGIRLWDLAAGSVSLSAINHASLGQLISFSPDGTRLATLNGEEITVFDYPGGSILQSFPGWNHAAISPDWSLLATVALGDQVLLLYDMASGSLLRRMTDRGEKQIVRAMFFSPDGRVLAQKEYADENLLLLWDPVSGSLLHTVPDAYDFLAFSPDGNTFATVGKQDENPLRATVQFWDAASGAQTGSLPIVQAMVGIHGYNSVGETFLDALAFSPDGTRIAAIVDNVVVLADRESGTVDWISDAQCIVCDVLAFSPDGRVLAVGGWDVNHLALLDVSSGALLAELSIHPWHTQLAFSADGMQLVSSGDDGVLYFWGVRP